MLRWTTLLAFLALVYSEERRALRKLGKRQKEGFQRLVARDIPGLSSRELTDTCGCVPAVQETPVAPPSPAPTLAPSVPPLDYCLGKGKGGGKGYSGKAGKGSGYSADGKGKAGKGDDGKGKAGKGDDGKGKAGGSEDYHRSLIDGKGKGKGGSSADGKGSKGGKGYPTAEELGCDCCHDVCMYEMYSDPGKGKAGKGKGKAGKAGKGKAGKGEGKAGKGDGKAGKGDGKAGKGGISHDEPDEEYRVRRKLADYGKGKGESGKGESGKGEGGKGDGKGKGGEGKGGSGDYFPGYGSPECTVEACQCETPLEPTESPVTPPPVETESPLQIVDAPRECTEDFVDVCVCGDSIYVDYCNTNPEFDDWIGIFDCPQDFQSTYNYHPDAWVWTCFDDVCDEPQGSGSLVFDPATLPAYNEYGLNDFPLEPGCYVAVLNRNYGESPPPYVFVVQSVQFWV